MEGFPKDIKISIDESRYWEGLGRQEMDFHQVIGELIDNSISASGKDTDGDLLPFNIEITRNFTYPRKVSKNSTYVLEIFKTWRKLH